MDVLFEIQRESPESMCVSVQTEFNFACNISTKRWDIVSRVLLRQTHQENIMNKDQVEGRVEEVKGKVKEVTGRVLDDADMEVEGNVQKNVGKVQAGFGDLKSDVKDKL